MTHIYYTSETYIPLCAEPTVPHVISDPKSSSGNIISFIDENDYLEKVLLPQSVLQIKELPDTKWVEVVDSPYAPYCSKPVYTLRKLLTPYSQTMPVKVLPSLSQVLNTLESLEHVPYLYGGSAPHGIQNIFKDFISQPTHHTDQQRLQQLTGVDCSSLFAIGTNGFLYPNSGDIYTLVNQQNGTHLDIYGKSIPKILTLTRPGDMLHFNGHMMFFLDNKTVIQAVNNNGDNARAFNTTTEKKYGAVTIDHAEPILNALIDIRNIFPVSTKHTTNTFNISRLPWK